MSELQGVTTDGCSPGEAQLCDLGAKVEIICPDESFARFEQLTRSSEERGASDAGTMFAQFFCGHSGQKSGAIRITRGALLDAKIGAYRLDFDASGLSEMERQLLKIRITHPLTRETKEIGFDQLKMDPADPENPMQVQGGFA